MPEEVHKKCMSELNKLKNMSPMSAEATVVRNYIDWMGLIFLGSKKIRLILI